MMRITLSFIAAVAIGYTFLSVEMAYLAIPGGLISYCVVYYILGLFFKERT